MLPVILKTDKYTNPSVLCRDKRGSRLAHGEEQAEQVSPQSWAKSLGFITVQEAKPIFFGQSLLSSHAALAV